MHFVIINEYYGGQSDAGTDGDTTMYGPNSATAKITDISAGKTIMSAARNYQLGNAYPNPFNGRTSIQFSMEQGDVVKIELYNLRGQKIRTLMAEKKETGSYAVSWNGTNDFGRPVSSGIYLYTMTINSFQASKKIGYLK